MDDTSLRYFLLELSSDEYNSLHKWCTKNFGKQTVWDDKIRKWELWATSVHGHGCYSLDNNGKPRNYYGLKFFKKEFQMLYMLTYNNYYNWPVYDDD